MSWVTLFFGAGDEQDCEQQQKEIEWMEESHGDAVRVCSAAHTRVSSDVSGISGSKFGEYAGNVQILFYVRRSQLV